MRLVFNSVFEADFAELVVHFAAVGGPDLSRRFEDEVCRLAELLLRHPELGRARHDLKPEGIRSFRLKRFQNYLLFYQIKGDELILWRLRYGGMNLPVLFLGFD